MDVRANRCGNRFGGVRVAPTSRAQSNLGPLFYDHGWSVRRKCRSNFRRVPGRLDIPKKQEQFPTWPRVSGMPEMHEIFQPRLRQEEQSMPKPLSLRGLLIVTLL